MTTLKLNGQTIIDTFQFEIVENYKTALAMGLNDYGWDESDVMEGFEKVSVKLEDGSIIEEKINCIYADAGSND